MNDILTDAVSFKDQTTSLFDANMKALSDNVERAAKNFPDAVTAIETAKKAIEAAIHDTSSKNRMLRASATGASNDSLLANTDIQDLKDTVRSLRERVGKARELAALRREQTESLINRNDANLHSSWTGLLRPLHEESRLGLILMGVVFLLLTLGGLYFLYRMGFFTRSTSETPAFFGGAYRNMMKYLRL